MINNKKIFLIIALLTYVLTINSEVFAYTFNVDFADTGSQSGEEFDNETTISDIEGYRCPSFAPANATECLYSYTYNWNVFSNSAVNINGYNINNKPILEHGLKIKEEDKIASGTSIGLNIYETKTIRYKMEFKIQYKYKYKETNTKTEYWCKYTRYYPTGEKHDFDEILPEYNCDRLNGIYYPRKIWNGETEVWSDYEEVTNSIKGTEMYNSLKTDALNAVITDANRYVTNDYEVWVNDSNDINPKDENKSKIQLDTKITCSPCKFENKASLIGQDNPEDKLKIKTNFLFQKTCMNPQNGEVYYVGKNSGYTACKDNHIQIENEQTSDGETHFHYFIPLNAKSIDEIPIDIMLNTESTRTTKECLYVMQNNPIHFWNPMLGGNTYFYPTGKDNGNLQIDNSKTSYKELIVTKQNQSFIGDYYNCLNEKGEVRLTGKACSDVSIDYKNINENAGCKLTVQIKLLPKQEFYGEIDGGSGTKEIKGFNFYYRPIDINNPFPNNALQSNIWNKYYDNNDNKITMNTNTTSDDIKLSDSFKETSYSTKIKTEEIRTYNKLNPYTDWSKMHINGKSSFIDNKGIIERINEGNIYKLGCGPTKNTLNQGWCSK